jgi:NADH-quinone oxidoreductase subunit G
VATHHPQAALLRRLGALVAELSGAKLGFLPESGNSAGGWLAGAVPHRAAGGAPVSGGKDWRAMAEAGLKGYLLLGLEPGVDCIDPVAADNAMTKAGFVVALTAYDSPALRAQADVLLPIALFAETSGTYVNAEGRWQSFTGAATPPGQARPAWKLLRVMGNLFDVPGFEFMASDEVLAEVRAACAGVQPDNAMAWQPARVPAAPSGLVRITDFPLYAVDPMVRRSAPLQATTHARPAAVYASAATLAKAGLSGAGRVTVSHGEGSATLALVGDERVPDGCVYIPSAQAGSETLGGAFAVVAVKQA